MKGQWPCLRGRKKVVGEGSDELVRGVKSLHLQRKEYQGLPMYIKTRKYSVGWIIMALGTWDSVDIWCHRLRSVVQIPGKSGTCS